MFGSAYQEAGVSPADRPEYGALNLMSHADGASPRFGSCYLELQPHVTRRCSLTWGDSYERPKHVGTSDVFEHIALALFDTCVTVATGTSRPWRSPRRVGCRRILARRAALILRAASRNPCGGSTARKSTGRVHRGAGPRPHRPPARHRAHRHRSAFDGGPSGMLLRAFATRYGLPLCVHPGFVLSTTEVPPNFRGPHMVPLASRIAEQFGSRDELDAAAPGRAAEALHRDPARWSDWAGPHETWQHIKQLWHVLVRFGRRRLGSNNGGDAATPRSA